MHRNQPAATAYHEAGRAVATILMEIEIGPEGFSVVPGEGFGMAHLLVELSGKPDLEATDAMRLEAEKYAIATLAGMVAQQKYRKSSMHSYYCQSDRHNAADLMSHFVASDRELTAYLNWLQIRAEQLVASEWTMIESVAEALIERDRLSAKEAKEIAMGAE
jgi:hypothetical protein